MALQVINNGEDGLIVRQKLNSMFAELYSGIQNVPTIIRNVTGAQTYTVPANTFVIYIFAKAVSGTPSMIIGTTLGGNDIADVTAITTTPQAFLIQQAYPINTVLYFTVSGYVDIRIDPITNLF